MGLFVVQLGCGVLQLDERTYITNYNYLVDLSNVL